MKFLFIGGNGNISWSCSQAALAAGHEVWALNRGLSTAQKRPLPPAVRVVHAEADNETQVKAVLAGQKFDCVADFVCFHPSQAQKRVGIYREFCRQYIFISTASAYQKPLTMAPVTESTPLKNPWWQYSRDKIECENVFFGAYRESDFPVTVVRPSHTYDTIIPSAMGSSGWTNSARMLAGKPTVLHGDGTTLWTLTHAEDFANAFVGLMGNQDAVGNAFHITSDEWLTWRQIAETVAYALGAPRPEFVCVPSEKIAQKDPDLGAGLLGDKAWCGIFDNSKIKRFVPGWQAKIPFRVGIERSLAWFYEKEERRVVNPKLDKFLDELCAL
jgi:nucleoside-diphosphate-sugar epimerase